MENKAAKSGFTFSFIIIQKKGSPTFYGMVKEVDGVVVKGKSEKDVTDKIFKAINAMNAAKRKASTTNDIMRDDSDFMVVKEFEQKYEPCEA